MRLVQDLPATGRLSYDSEDMRALKPRIRELVDLTIKSSKPFYDAFTHFCGETEKIDRQTRAFLIANKIPEKFWDRYLKADAYLEDMYRRLGNQILNYARVFKKKERPAKGRLAQKRIRKRTAASVLLRTAEIAAAIEADADYFFKEYLRKLEEAREENENQGESEINEME